MVPSSEVAQRQEQPTQLEGFTKGTSSEADRQIDHHGLMVYVKGMGKLQGGVGGKWYSHWCVGQVRLYGDAVQLSLKAGLGRAVAQCK